MDENENLKYIYIHFYVIYLIIAITITKEIQSRIDDYQNELQEYEKLKSKNFKRSRGFISCFFKGKCYDLMDKDLLENNLKIKERSLIIKEKETCFKFGFFLAIILPLQILFIFKFYKSKNKLKMNLDEISNKIKYYYNINKDKNIFN